MFYLWNIKIKVWQGPRGPSVSPPLWLCGIILSPICQDALKGPRWSFFTAFWVARIQHFLKVKLFGGRCGGRGRSYRKFPILSTDPINSPQMVILNHSNNSAFPCKRLSWSTLPSSMEAHLGFSRFLIRRSGHSFHHLDLCLAVFQQAHSFVECGVLVGFLCSDGGPHV